MGVVVVVVVKNVEVSHTHPVTTLSVCSVLSYTPYNTQTQWPH